MSTIIAIGVSSGIIAGLWTIMSFSLGLSTVAGFLAWSSFFAAGGGEKGIKKALIANLSGICWGVITLKMSKVMAPQVDSLTALAIVNAIGSAFICWQSKSALFSFIPGSFIGWSAFIACGMDFKVAILSMTMGSLLGYASEKLTGLILKLKSKAKNNCAENISIENIDELV